MENAKKDVILYNMVSYLHVFRKDNIRVSTQSMSSPCLFVLLLQRDRKRERALFTKSPRTSATSHTTVRCYKVPDHSIEGYQFVLALRTDKMI